ncbi:MAG: hypothetical protein JOZ82_14150 [Marmoricola sp.]|nr:hypothetical protein [Marmoricola sp.]
MSAPTGLVAAGTLALGSPALWLMAHDQLSLDDTLLRLGVCAAICWLALSMVAGLAPTPPRTRAPMDEVPASQDEESEQVP